MFGLKHPRGKGFIGIPRQDRHPRLTKDGACVKVCGHFVHGAACFGITCGKGAGVGVKPGVFWQKRGVDVQHPAFEAGDEIGRQDAHEARKAKDIGAGGVNVVQEFPLERQPVAAKRSVIDGGHRDAKGRGLGQAGSGGVIGGDQNGARGMIARH